MIPMYSSSLSPLLFRAGMPPMLRKTGDCKKVLG